MKLSNPFTFLGSYVGLAIGIAADYFAFGLAFALAETGNFEPLGFIVLLTPPILGFLIGWQIHEKIRNNSESKN